MISKERGVSTIATKTRSRRKNSGKRAKQWSTYEEVARYVLQQLGRRFNLAEVEGKQKVPGRLSGTEWEIDAKGVRDGDGAIILVECRRYTKGRLNQEALAAVAYRIMDIGAAGGITVSPLPRQKGAEMVAKANGVEHVQLTSKSTRDNWVAKIGSVIHMGLTERAGVKVSDSFELTVRDREGNVVDQRRG